MKTKNEEFEVLVPNLDGIGIAERVKVSVPLKWDEELGEWLLTVEAHQIIENTKARRMGLLLPLQFKELRERYKYSQLEMGELFQVGEKSWTRWESGKHRPSRSINLLIQALYEGEISINYLLKRAGKPPRPEPEWSSPAFSWQSFTGLSFAQTNLAMVVLPDHLTVAGCAGSLQSPYHDIMVRLLQKQDLSTEVKPWIGTESSDFYTRAASVTERPLSRFKFPEAA